MDPRLKQSTTLNVNNYALIQTWHSAPEQYEVFKGGKNVGYLRLKYGTLRVFYPGVTGNQIASFETKGYSSFEEEEKTEFLEKAVAEIDKHIKKDSHRKRRLRR